MKKTLTEHIDRIKEISLYGEAVDQNMDQELSKMIDSPQFQNNLQQNMNSMMTKIQKDIMDMGSKVGDKDGQLEIQTESYRISESVVGLGIGAAIAAPKIAEILGTGLRKLGVKLNSKILQKLGAKGEKFGHMLHDKYHGFVKNILNKLPQYKRLPEDRKELIVKGVMLAIISGALIASFGGAGSAFNAGQIATGAAETGLTGVKTAEIMEMLPELGEILPIIFAQIFK